MGRRDGGTRMFCPHCRGIRVCFAVSLADLGHDREQRAEHRDFADIQWFRRARACYDCSNVFLTGELDESLIEELANLRKVVSELKARLDHFDCRSADLMKSVSEISEVLRSLDNDKR